MILASFDHAEEDIEARQLIEAKNEAETILGAVEKGKNHPSWVQLSSYEMATIEMEIGQLKATLDSGSYRAIRNGIERLDKATRRFAEVMMDTEVMDAMKGQTMEAASVGMGGGLGDTPHAPHPFAKAEFEEDEDKA
jgi:molecular chaperone DnaK/molecular chaperone HscA